MFKKFLVFAVLFGSFASAFAASPAKPFSYRVEVPAAAATCDQEAAALGQRFAQATGLTVSSSVCQSTQTIEKQSVFTLVVNYLAAAQVAPYSAVYTSEGIFKSYVDCLAALPAQQIAYTSNTGLSILASGCTAASIGDGFSPYIDGIGTPTLRFFSVAPSFETSLNEVPGIYDVFKAQLVAAGAVIVYTGEYDIFYYASDRVTISHNNITSYFDATQCQAESASMQQIYASSGVNAIVSCLSEEFSSMTILFVSWDGDSFPIMSDHGYTSIVYNSFDECQQDKPRVVQNSVSSGSDATGAICEVNQDGHGYVIEVFTKAPAISLAQ